MDNKVRIAQDEPSLPPHAEQANGTQSGYPVQLGYPAQPDYPAHPAGYPAHPAGYPAHPAGYPTQPGYPQKESYPTQHPYSAQPLQTYPPVQEQQTNTTVVMQPTPQAVILPAPPRPQSWLGLSIFSCLFCLWPCGLAAIIYSNKVNSLYAAGDYEGAKRNADTARNLNTISIIGGIIMIVILIIRAVTASNQLG